MLFQFLVPVFSSEKISNSDRELDFDFLNYFPLTLEIARKSANAMAFIGDDSSCTNFESIAKKVGISTIFQVKTLEKNVVKNGRICFDSLWKAVPAGTKFVSPVPLYSSDLAFLYFTSGTTGNPKIVLLEQEYILGHYITAGWYRLRVGDCE